MLAMHIVLLGLLSPSRAVEPPVPDFAREVRPILSQRCFACHGPDAAARKGELRLDRRDVALGERVAGPVVVPGDLEASELWRRVASTDPERRMPPPEASEEGLSPRELDLLRRWIEGGAPWEEHWAFVPAKRPAEPEVRHAPWVRNPIDAFVLAQLEAAGLEPAPQADRATLLRRATLDLTGLPPTVEELDDFFADDAPDAYERALERLFASPRHGEHLARFWLDAARYADTHGLHLDNERSMWPYRDWVIGAFQTNLPYDRFVIEQLAGDLLDDPTIDQLVASGFNRCNPTSAEGGMIEEEYLALYAKDRVDTTATVFLGATLECAKCHDHKFDPFTQRDYYSLLAFFNSLAEEASDRNIANPVPFLRVASEEQRAALEAGRRRVAALAERLAAPSLELDAAQAAWEAEWRARLARRWRILVPERARSSGGATLALLADDSVAATGANPARDVYEIEAHAGEERISALRLELLAPDDERERIPGRAHNQNFVLSGVELEAWPAGAPELAARVPLARAAASFSQEGFPIEGVLDDDPETGWAGLGAAGSRSALLVPAEPFGFRGGTMLRVHLRHESRFSQHGVARVRLAVSEEAELAPSRLSSWWRLGPIAAGDGPVALARDFGPEAGVTLGAQAPDLGAWREQGSLADGVVHRFDPAPGVVYLWRTLDAPSERALTVALGSDDGVRLWLDGRLVHDNPAARVVRPDEDTVELTLGAGRHELLLKVANYGGDFAFAFRVLDEELGGAPLDAQLLLESEGERDEAARARLRDVFRRRFSPTWAELASSLGSARAELAALEERLPTTLVSRELDPPRPAHVLRRGQYDQPGERVERAVPAVLPPLPPDAPKNRLGLARWIVARENPLAARVAANRLWQQVFGQGLVRTPEDFGSQGRFPTHPELLDWLACELVERGWDRRHLLRLMLTSSTYRQSSALTPAALERDPENRLLARAPRWRLDAEVVRDSALHVSGLLVEEVGGASVRPYQPSGVWEAVGYTTSNTANFRADTGPALYRRSLYTFWKRTAPPPNLACFDAPSREACTVQRARTNTPLQALVLLNDPQFVEAARHFAARALRERGPDDDARLAWLFRSATSRAPGARERDLLRAALAEQRALFAQDAPAARALLGVGDSPRDETLDPVEHAAWTQVASLLLNLDEALTRG